MKKYPHIELFLFFKMNSVVFLLIETQIEAETQAEGETGSVQEA